MAFLIVGLVTGAGYLVAIWRWTRDVADARGVRQAAIWAVAGSIVLGIIAIILNTNCELAENGSDLFNERCEGSTPDIPLYVIPLLLVAPFLRRSMSGPLLWFMGAMVVVVAVTISGELLSV
jgi:hypothetical protein